MLEEIKSMHGVLALEKFAHNPNFPVTQEWEHLVEEMIEHLNKTTKTPVYAVGHSFGAVISYMAVCKYPDKFKGLIMLDPPLLTGMTAFFIRRIRHTKMFDKLTPAGKSQSRCIKWPLETDLVSYFSSRALFKNMHPQCIQDYVNAAVRTKQDSYHLDFNREIETEIFRTIPLYISRFIGMLNRPSLLVSGGASDVSIPRMIKPFIKKNNMQHKIVDEGGHMFPLEQPTLVGQMIARQVSKWEGI